MFDKRNAIFLFHLVQKKEDISIKKGCGVGIQSHWKKISTFGAL